jgi:hypothetical protein
MMTNSEKEMNMSQDFHDLSQPLTRLQWRLELAKLTEDGVELRESIAVALLELGEVIARVRKIRRKTEGQQGFTGRAA